MYTPETRMRSVAGLARVAHVAFKDDIDRHGQQPRRGLLRHLLDREGLGVRVRGITKFRDQRVTLVSLCGFADPVAGATSRDVWS